MLLALLQSRKMRRVSLVKLLSRKGQPSETDVPDEETPVKSGLDIYGFAQLDNDL
jgi:hypothetical protein